MKSITIIAIAILAFTAFCTSAPVSTAQLDADLQARLSIFTFLYENILQDLFSGLVTNTFGTISNTLNNLIETNPLGIGKRDAQSDLAARLSIFTFLYDNILQDLFSGLVTNTFGTISNTLNNLIETNPLGIGKRDAQSDLAARLSVFTFLYENILQDLFSGLVTNTFGTISNTLNNLIETNPLGIGKRDAQSDLAARLSIFTFLYENILQDLFSGLVTNTFGTISNTLNNLIETNPLGIGKRSVNIDQIQAIFTPAASDLIQKLKKFIHQALSALNNQLQLTQIVDAAIADIKVTIAGLIQQISTVIPSTLVSEVSQILAGLQSVLLSWTSGLAGSLGPVMGVLRP